MRFSRVQRLDGHRPDSVTYESTQRHLYGHDTNISVSRIIGKSIFANRTIHSVSHWRMATYQSKRSHSTLLCTSGSQLTTSVIATNRINHDSSTALPFDISAGGSSDKCSLHRRLLGRPKDCLSLRIVLANCAACTCHLRR